MVTGPAGGVVSVRVRIYRTCKRGEQNAAKPTTAACHIVTTCEKINGHFPKLGIMRVRYGRKEAHDRHQARPRRHRRRTRARVWALGRARAAGGRNDGPRASANGCIRTVAPFSSGIARVKLASATAYDRAASRCTGWLFT